MFFWVERAGGRELKYQLIKVENELSYGWIDGGLQRKLLPTVWVSTPRNGQKT